MSIRLNYSIARELGITPFVQFGVYPDRKHILVPTNRYLKPILDEYHRRKRVIPQPKSDTAGDRADRGVHDVAGDTHAGSSASPAAELSAVLSGASVPVSAIPDISVSGAPAESAD